MSGNSRFAVFTLCVLAMLAGVFAAVAPSSATHPATASAVTATGPSNTYSWGP
jgi:hypothetical protein